MSTYFIILMNGLIFHDTLTFQSVHVFMEMLFHWQIIHDTNKQIANQLGFEFTFVKSNFRSMINYGIINQVMKSKYPEYDNYWYDLQHGFILNTIFAPFSFINGYNIQFIASTQELGAELKLLPASNPLIDESVSFGNTFTIHKSFKKSRNAKIKNIMLWTTLNDYRVTYKQ